jgi:hypothetical protein
MVDHASWQSANLPSPQDDGSVPQMLQVPHSAADAARHPKGQTVKHTSKSARCAGHLLQGLSAPANFGDSMSTMPTLDSTDLYAKSITARMHTGVVCTVAGMIVFFLLIHARMTSCKHAHMRPQHHQQRQLLHIN